MQRMYILQVAVLLFQLMVARPVFSVTIGPEELIASTLSNVWNLVPDRYFTSQIFVSSDYSVHKLDLKTQQLTKIAGSESGYLEGVGDQARFRKFIFGLIQLNQTTIVVSDFGNDCLRSITNGATQPFAGQCQMAGSDDGLVLEGKFFRPWGLVQSSISQIYVADAFNHAIRLIDTGLMLLSTIIKPGEINAPHYLVCQPPNCDDIYITLDDAVLQMNVASRHLQTISGQAGASGSSLGNFTTAQFDSPRGLMFLNENLLMVADWRNHRILLLYLKLRSVEVLTNRTDAHSILCWNGTLYMGTENIQGLHKATIYGMPTNSTCFTTSFDPDIDFVLPPNSAHSSIVVIAVGSTIAVLICIIIVVVVLVCKRNALARFSDPIQLEHFSPQDSNSSAGDPPPYETVDDSSTAHFEDGDGEYYSYAVTPVNNHPKADVASDKCSTNKHQLTSQLQVATHQEHVNGTTDETNGLASTSGDVLPSHYERANCNPQDDRFYTSLISEDHAVVDPKYANVAVDSGAYAEHVGEKV